MWNAISSTDDFKLIDSLNIELALIYLNDYQLEKADFLVNKISANSKQFELACCIKANIFLQYNNPDSALFILNNISKSENIEIQKETALLKILCFNYFFDKKNALLNAGLLDSICRSDKKMQNYVLENYPKKIKRYSGLLCRIVPGLSFINAKESSKAFVNMLLVSSFAAYTVFSIYTGYYVTATFTGFLNWMKFQSGGNRGGKAILAHKNEINTATFNSGVVKFYKQSVQ